MRLHLTQNKTSTVRDVDYFFFEGLKIGSVVEIPEIGMIKITGGSGKSGAPMRKDLEKPGRSTQGRLVLPNIVNKNIETIDAIKINVV